MIVWRYLPRLALLFALVALLVWVMYTPAPVPPASLSEESEPSPTPLPMPIEVEEELEELEAFVAPPLPPQAVSPSPARADDDPCAPLDEPTHIERPALGSIVEARHGELLARVRTQDDASASLRDGFSALFRTSDPEPALAQIASAPDRVVQGFDHAAAAALHVAMVALHEERFTVAMRWARRASTLARHDPAGPVLEAIIALRSDDHHSAGEALREAFAREPEEPAIAWALAMRLSRTDELELALRAFDAYLLAFPSDLGARRQRTLTERRAAAIAGSTRLARRGIVLRAHPSLDATSADGALTIIDEALTEAARWTGTTRAPELLVIVHRNRDAMRAATCSPSWSGALFDGVVHVDAETIARSGARRRDVLRHESLHAQLHARPGGSRHAAPYWLEEGMAQRFTGEESAAHHRSWAMMVREQTWIPLASIAGAFTEIDDSRDAGLAYHQSLAMVRYLEARHGARAIADAVAAIDRGVHPDELLGVVAPELDGRALLAFLAQLSPE
jgi:hypothetical protein